MSLSYNPQFSDIELAKVRPLHDRVLILPDPAEGLTSDLIIILEESKQIPARGTVVAAGPGRMGEPNTVIPGQRVGYAKFAGSDVEIEGKQYKFMRDTDVMYVINEKDERTATEEKA